MHKLVRIYYRMCRGISLSENISLQGDLSGVKNSQIKFGSGAEVSLGKNVSIRNSKIEVTGGELIIEDGVSISVMRLPFRKVAVYILAQIVAWREAIIGVIRSLYYGMQVR